MADEKNVSNTKIDRRSVELALDEIRPAFYLDGGDIRLVDIHPDGTVEIALSGTCQGCGFSILHIKHGVEQYLRMMIPEIKEVITTDMF
ncbi:MAG: NifU family protein [bacterium]